MKMAFVSQIKSFAIFGGIDFLNAYQSLHPGGMPDISRR
jgi:hypothetical protein